MENAVSEAKGLVERMEQFIGDNSGSVKNFIERQKHEVT